MYFTIFYLSIIDPMDKDITEELEENVMSLVPETTTTTQGNLFWGIVNWWDPTGMGLYLLIRSVRQT